MAVAVGVVGVQCHDGSGPSDEGSAGHAAGSSGKGAAQDASADATGAAPGFDGTAGDAAGHRDASTDAVILTQCPNDLDPPILPVPAPDRPFAAVDARVRALIQQMSVAEKTEQLGDRTPRIERLGLPAYQYWNEALHGVLTVGATSFPVPLAMGATWDPDLVRRVASAISDEARAFAKTRGAPLTYFSPTINIVRDPRWGRTEESYGEDPHLLSRMAVAFVEGMQGDDPEYLKTVATAKHFLANNYEKGRLGTSSEVDERTLREYYEPQFRAVVTEAKVYSVMAAYNGVNGVPMVDHRAFLEDLLRREWGFGGYVVSDCGAIAYSYTHHGHVADPTAAAAAAMNAGTDLECVANTAIYAGYLANAVAEEKVATERLDEALLRVLRGRFLLGEFEPEESVPFSKIDASSVQSSEHQELARQAARESMVLLKNATGLLPLGDQISSIAVVGPYADKVVLGGYSGTPSRSASVLSGIRERLPDAEILTTDSSDPSEVASVAARAGVAVLVLGTDSRFAAEGLDAPGLELPDGQEEMAKAVLAANAHTVVVLMAGAPVTFPWIRDNAPSILYGWYAGQEGGFAIADVLFGDANPGGRLPLTLYASTEQLPSITNYGIRGDDSEGMGRTYMYFDERKLGPVLYPFGHGLSYTEFQYDSLQLCPADPTTLWVSARVTNRGTRAGDEVVQLYIRDTAPGIVRPKRSLKAFRRVSLDAGASRLVTLPVSLDDCGYWDTEAHRFVVATGELGIEVGASSEDIRLSATVHTDGVAILR